MEQEDYSKYVDTAFDKLCKEEDERQAQQDKEMREMIEADERRAKDLSNRTITMESRDNVWAWRKIIEDNQSDSKLSVEIWERDCDQFESTSLKEINATIDALATLVENVQEHAEGPWSLTVLNQREVYTWERHERDHAAEQMNY